MTPLRLKCAILVFLAGIAPAASMVAVSRAIIDSRRAPIILKSNRSPNPEDAPPDTMSPRAILGLTIPRWIKRIDAWVLRGEVGLLIYTIQASLMVRPAESLPRPFDLRRLRNLVVVAFALGCYFALPWTMAVWKLMH